MQGAAQEGLITLDSSLAVQMGSILAHVLAVNTSVADTLAVVRHSNCLSVQTGLGRLVAMVMITGSNVQATTAVTALISSHNHAGLAVKG